MTSLIRLGRKHGRSYGKSTDYPTGLQLYESYGSPQEETSRPQPAHDQFAAIKRMRDDAIIYTLLGTTFIETIIILFLIQKIGRS